MDYEGEDAHINAFFFFNANSIALIKVSSGLWFMHFWILTPLPESLPSFPEEDDSRAQTDGKQSGLESWTCRFLAGVTLGKLFSLSGLLIYQ